jgi:hypothetical protein
MYDNPAQNPLLTRYREGDIISGWAINAFILGNF